MSALTTPLRHFLAIALSAVLVMATGVAARAMTSITIDVASGKVLSQDDASARWYPASTTKLMTAYIALRDITAGQAALDAPVVMTRMAATAVPSKMGYQPGSVMRLDNALRMIMVKSANDVAVAIGQSLANGSLEAFVARMNSEAERLGMRDSHFINPNGLPGPGQHSSAKDLAILAMAIRREFPAFADFFSTEAISTGETTMKSSNNLLGRYAGADGMKTGYICASGFNIVASATHGDRTIVAVVLGAEGPIARARVAAELLENGFKADIAKIETRVDQLPASSGAPADISQEICSQTGRTARANERDAEGGREETYGSPYLKELGRPLVAVPVALGGASGRTGIEPGISVIAAYGIPIPTWRPADVGPVADDPVASNNAVEAARRDSRLDTAPLSAAEDTGDAAGSPPAPSAQAPAPVN